MVRVAIALEGLGLPFPSEKNGANIKPNLCGIGDLEAELRQGTRVAEATNYASLIKQCGNAAANLKGRIIHALVIKVGHEKERFLGNLLIEMYAKCGNLDDARRVFDRINYKNVFSWTIMIGAYEQHDQDKEALHLFLLMQKEGVVPNKVTFSTILNACSSTGAVAEGKRLHALLRETHTDVIVGTALVNMYRKFGNIDWARHAFKRIHNPNLISFNAMLTAYAENGSELEALAFFRTMQIEGIMPDNVTWIIIINACATFTDLELCRCIHQLAANSETDPVVGSAIVSMYGKCRSLVDARVVFNKIWQKDAVCWGAMISAYAQNDLGRQALDLYQEMQDAGMLPSTATCVSVLNASASLSALDAGKQMHQQVILHEGLLNSAVKNALINMYAKCGNLKDMQLVFQGMLNRDMVSWTTVISAYGQMGHGKAALQFFQGLQLGGIRPTSITFLSTLSACGHAGLQMEGCHQFLLMTSDYAVVQNVEHYSCLIDLLGRVGWLEVAIDLIYNMMFKPSVRSWIAFLGACKVHHDIERAKVAATHITELDPSDAASYILLSNIYAADCQWELLVADLNEVWSDPL